MPDSARIAYFSMEIGLEDVIPTYAGGLGVLAGDTIRSAADLGIPMVGVTLLARSGYFHQRIDATGWQSEEPEHWPVVDYLTEMPQRVTVAIEDRRLTLRAWRYQVKGLAGAEVPVFLLDADLKENIESDRRLTDYLYGGDAHYRLCQEIILGIGGVRMLRALGYEQIARYHLNEGHSALLILELLAERTEQGAEPGPEVLEAVRRQCVFTTHTPVASAQDQFPLEMARRLLGPSMLGPFVAEMCCDETLNMTYLALNHSHYVNGVAKKHREVSRRLYANHRIDSITNGVHLATWAARPMRELFDRHIPGWREDNPSLRYALSVPPEEIRAAHHQSKQALVEFVNRVSNVGMDTEAFTLGFARRATRYKRFTLLFQDPQRLARICEQVGPLQLVFAGKAHPHDLPGKELIQQIYRVGETLKGQIKIAYLSGYDMALGRLLTAGSDVWLNTPQPPMEASGSSGMKAAVNGVPSLSVLDGWWTEGCIEGITGWAIGEGQAANSTEDSVRDAAALYDKLEHTVMPLYYADGEGFTEVMRHAIALNASFFNTERMLNQYIAKAYFK